MTPVPRVRLFDHRGRPVGPLAQVESGECVFSDRVTGTGQIVVPVGAPRSDILLRAETLPALFVVIDHGGARWAGRVVVAREGGPVTARTITARLVHVRRYLHHIAAWPNPGLPLFAQFPPQDIRTGRLPTVMTAYLRDNLSRMFGTANPDAPIQVLDPPPADAEIVSLAARMTPMDELFRAVLDRSHWGVRASLWLPGDPTPPRLTLRGTTILMQALPRVDRPDVVWRNGITDTGVDHVAPQGGNIITGGRSNDLANQIARALTGSELLTDVLAAFTEAQNPSVFGEPYAFPETVVAGGAAAFTTEAAEAAANGVRENQGDAVAAFTVEDTLGKVFGRDYREGDTVGAIIGGRLYRAPVDTVRVAWGGSTSGVAITPTVGQAAQGGDPLSRLVQLIHQLKANQTAGAITF